MKELNRHDLSIRSDTITQKSPQKYTGAMHLGSPSNSSGVKNGGHNPQIEYMRLKEQYRRQIEAYYREIQLLKQKLYCRNEQIQNFQDNVILKLRQQLNQCRRDNIKHCQNQQKLRKDNDKLKNDNQSLLLENQRTKKQRQIYSDKLNHIKNMHDDIKIQLESKQKNYRRYYELSNALKKQMQTLKYEKEDLKNQINERQKLVYDSQSQYKNILQRSFQLDNQLKSLHIRCRDQDLIINAYKQKSVIMEKQRQQLLDRLDQYQKSDDPQLQHGLQTDKNSLIEIQSLIMQVHNVLNVKAHERQKIEKYSQKFKIALSDIQHTLTK